MQEGSQPSAAAPQSSPVGQALCYRSCAIMCMRPVESSWRHSVTSITLFLLISLRLAGINPGYSACRTQNHHVCAGFSSLDPLEEMPLLEVLRGTEGRDLDCESAQSPKVSAGYSTFGSKSAGAQPLGASRLIVRAVSGGPTVLRRFPGWFLVCQLGTWGQVVAWGGLYQLVMRLLAQPAASAA